MKHLKSLSSPVLCAAFLLSGCSASVTGQVQDLVPGNVHPRGGHLGDHPAPGYDGKIDLNGRWSGSGTANPGNFWSVSFDSHQAQGSQPPYPENYSTRCKVKLEMIQRPDYLRVVSAEITFPDNPELSYFDAQLTDEDHTPSGSVTSFDRAEYRLKETQSGSGELSLYPIHKDGTVDGVLYDDTNVLSFKDRKLVFSSSGPYKGTYKSGEGGAYTTSRNFKFSWPEGRLMLDSLEFSTYGSSVSHAIDAMCSGVALSRLAN